MKEKNHCQKNSKSKRIKKHLYKIDSIIYFISELIQVRSAIGQKHSAKLKKYIFIHINHTKKIIKLSYYASLLNRGNKNRFIQSFFRLLFLTLGQTKLRTIYKIIKET